MIPGKTAEKMHGKLIVALESARMRFSVAIASESKSTPRDRYHYYIETTERAGRCIRLLRANGSDMEGDPLLFGRVLERLRIIPEQNNASRLCELLQTLVSELERSAR